MRCVGRRWLRGLAPLEALDGLFVLDGDQAVLVEGLLQDAALAAAVLQGLFERLVPVANQVLVGIVMINKCLFYNQ